MRGASFPPWGTGGGDSDRGDPLHRNGARLHEARMNTDSANPRIEDLLVHASWIQNLARRLVHDESTADDLVQETWIAALQSPPSLDRSPRPWLAKVLRNFALQRLRAERSRKVREERRSQAERPLPSSAELVERAEMQKGLVERVLELPDPYRSTLLLHYYEGCSLAEIARRKGIPSATVRSHLRRGIDRMRSDLDENHGGREAWCLLFAPLIRDPAQQAVTWSARTLALTAAGVALIALGFLAWRGFGASSSHAAGPDAALVMAPLPNPEVEAGSPLRELEETTVRTATTSGGGAGTTPNEVALPVPLRARVIDEATGEPVPFYDVHVGDRDNSEWARTDAEGFLETEQPWLPGELGVRFHDFRDEPHVREAVIEHAPETALLETRVGPTYRFDLDVPADARGLELFAQLWSELDKGGSSVRRIGMGHAWTRSGRRVGQRPARVHLGPRSWVRFPADSTSALGVGPPWRLEVHSADGRFRASTDVESIVGVHTVANMTLAPSATVRGLVTDSEGVPFRRLDVHLRRQQGVARIVTNDDGEFLFTGVEQDDYDLTVSLLGRRLARARIRVLEGEETTHEFVLPRRSTSSTFEGTVESDTGRFDDPCSIRLGILDGSQFIETDVVWEDRGTERVGRFCFERFPDLPLSSRVSFTVEMHSLHEWSADTRAVRPGGEVEITIHDDVPTRSLILRPIDSVTGEVVPRYSCVLVVPGKLKTSELDLRADSLLVEEVPLHRPIDYMVQIGGYVPVYGSLELDTSSEPVHVLEVPVTRGWGTRVVTSDTRGRRIRNVQVSLDGRIVGLTDENGVLDVAQDDAPRRILLARDGFRLVPSTRLDVDGRYDPTAWHELRVTLTATR